MLTCALLFGRLDASSFGFACSRLTPLDIDFVAVGSAMLLAFLLASEVVMTVFGGVSSSTTSISPISSARFVACVGACDGLGVKDSLLVCVE